MNTVDLPDPHFWGWFLRYDLDTKVVICRVTPGGNTLAAPQFKDPKRTWRNRLRRWKMDPRLYHPDLQVDRGL